MTQIRIWGTTIRIGDLIKVQHTESDGCSGVIGGTVLMISPKKVFLSDGTCCKPEDTLEIHKRAR